MKPVKLFEAFLNENEYADNRLSEDVIAITKLLKKMTASGDGYNFKISQSQGNHINWEENDDRPSWYITLYAFGEYAGICYINIDKKRIRAVIKSSKDLKDVLNFIKKQSKIIKPAILPSRFDTNDTYIHNMLAMTTLSKYININKL